MLNGDTKMTLTRELVVQKEPTGLWAMVADGETITTDKTYNGICNYFNTFVKTCEKYNIKYTVSFRPEEEQ